MKDIIKQAVVRVKTGKGTNEDKAIMHLLEQYKNLKQQMQSISETGAGNQNAAVHQSTPWYMQ